MQRLPTIFAALAVLAAGTAAAGPADEGFVTLFDGTDLYHWTASESSAWEIEDGAITLKRTDGELRNGDYLWTRQRYGDFVLELEFKTCEGYANSGVFLRTADRSDPVYTGMEVQVCNSHGREELSRGGTAGAIYDCCGPSKNAVKPAGQWNRYRITCRGSRIQVVLNGQLSLEMDLDRWTEPGRNPDGTSNKFPKALKDFAREGYVGLQDHGRPVWYRNIRIKRLGE